MRILFVHNAYQQRGGEESVVAAEIELLRRHGHEVEIYGRDNADAAHMSGMRLLTETVWSRRSHRDITVRIERFRPDVAHVHNTFPLISPSVYWAFAAAGVPVVQTLHNFRPLCLQAMFLRGETVCEDCLGRLPWRGVVHRCYRSSATASSAVATMVATHRLLGSYRARVTRYVALSRFARAKFIEAGFEPGRIAVKPNFADIPCAREQPRRGGLFVGRLSREKGISVLLELLRIAPRVALDVIGTGPLHGALAGHPRVRLMGWQDAALVYRHMRAAAYLLLPSLCYENFPRTVVEAFACGLPVIATRLGAMAELIDEGRTGLLFEPGSAHDLAEKISWAESHPDVMRLMGINARAEYEATFTPEQNYRQLLGIYADAMEHAKSGRRKPAAATERDRTHPL